MELVMKKITILACILLACSCSIVAPRLGLELNGYTWDKTGLVPELLPPETVVEQEFEWKKTIVPEAFEEDWIQTTIRHHLDAYDYSGTHFHNLPELYKNLVFDRVYLDIDSLSDEILAEYPAAEVFTLKNSMDLTRVRKGDILLTRNRYHMSILLFSRYSTHHALMAVRDPTSDEDPCFISSYPANFGGGLRDVTLLSNRDLQMEEFIVVLRLSVEDGERIDTACAYALEQLGKPYNPDYVLKSKEDSFYCTQLVYRSYLEAGINLDSNHNQWHDHGLVLPDEIYLSPYLRVVKFGN
jgi:uncharacterized protein YycO